MPSPFEILAQGDRNTASLFAGINAGLEATANRQERALNQVATLAVAKENIIQNRQKLDLAERKFKVDSFLDAARLNLSAAQSSAALELQARQLMGQDRGARMDYFNTKIQLTKDAAFAHGFLTGDWSASDNVAQAALDEFNNMNNMPVGDFDIQGHADRVNNFWKNTPSLFPLGSAGNLNGLELSVFGGSNDPNDSGVNNEGRRTGGDSGFHGVAISDARLEANGIPRAERNNVQVKITAENGKSVMVPITDKGAANEGRADVNPAIAEQLGGRVSYDSNGKLSGVDGTGKINLEFIDEGGNPFASNKTDLAKQFPPFLPTEAQTQAILTDPDSLEASVSKAPEKYAYVKTLEQANKIESKIMLHGANYPNQAKVAIADLHRNAPAYDGLRNSVLRRVASIEKADFTTSDAANIEQFSSQFQSLGGESNVFDDIVTKVGYRNQLRDNLKANNRELLSIKSEITSSSTISPEIFDEDVTRLRQENATMNFQLKAVADEINGQLGIPGLPQPVTTEEKKSVNDFFSQFGVTMTSEASAASIQAEAESLERFAERGLAENIKALTGSENLKNPAKLASAISEFTGKTIDDLGLGNQDHESLGLLKSQAKELAINKPVEIRYEPQGIKRNSPLDILSNRIISRLRDHPDVINESLINTGSGETDRKIASRYKAIIDSTTDEALAIMGKLLYSKGLVDKEDLATSSIDISSPKILGQTFITIDPIIAFDFIETAREYITDLSDKTNEEISGIIPILKASQILSKFAE